MFSDAIYGPDVPAPSDGGIPVKQFLREYERWRQYEGARDDNNKLFGGVWLDGCTFITVHYRLGSDLRKGWNKEPAGPDNPEWEPLEPHCEIYEPLSAQELAAWIRREPRYALGGWFEVRFWRTGNQGAKPLKRPLYFYLPESGDEMIYGAGLAKELLQTQRQADRIHRQQLDANSRALRESEVARERDRRIYEEERRDAAEKRMEEQRRQESGMVGVLGDVLTKLVPDPNAQATQGGVTIDDVYAIVQSLQGGGGAQDLETQLLLQQLKQKDSLADTLKALAPILATVLPVWLSSRTEAQQQQTQLLLALTGRNVGEAGISKQPSLWEHPVVAAALPSIVSKVIDGGGGGAGKSPAQAVEEMATLITAVQKLVPGGQPQESNRLLDIADKAVDKLFSGDGGEKVKDWASNFKDRHPPKDGNPPALPPPEPEQLTEPPPTAPQSAPPATPSTTPATEPPQASQQAESADASAIQEQVQAVLSMAEYSVQNGVAPEAFVQDMPDEGVGSLLKARKWIGKSIYQYVQDLADAPAALKGFSGKVWLRKAEKLLLQRAG